MTSLVCWAGVDARGTASLYIASDSRITWGGESRRWDLGRKVFASANRPEIYGYVGDVLFPSLVLGQVADSLGGIELTGAEQRFELFQRILLRSFCAYPEAEKRDFKICFATREDALMQSRFEVRTLEWSTRTGWTSAVVAVPKVSDTVVVWGSGASAVNRWRERWNSTSEGGTSRAVFGAFCDAIGSGDDRLSGGAPQLVGLYRKEAARVIGVVHRGAPYLFGLPADDFDSHAMQQEWRNHVFERCTPRGDLLQGAQRHRRPRGLAGTRQEK